MRFSISNYFLAPFYTSKPKEIKFEEKEYPDLPKEDTLTIEELELIDVIDINRYNKLQL